MFSSSDVIVMMTEGEVEVGIVVGEGAEAGIEEIENEKMLIPPLRSIMISLTALFGGHLLSQNKLLTWCQTFRVSPAPRQGSRLLQLRNSLSPGLIGAEPPLPPLKSFPAYQVCQSNDQNEKYSIKSH